MTSTPEIDQLTRGHTSMHRSGRGSCRGTREGSRGTGHQSHCGALDVHLVVALDVDFIVPLDGDVVMVLLEEEKDEVKEVWELHQRMIQQISMIL